MSVDFDVMNNKKNWGNWGRTTAIDRHLRIYAKNNPFFKLKMMFFDSKRAV